MAFVGCPVLHPVQRQGAPLLPGMDEWISSGHSYSPFAVGR